MKRCPECRRDYYDETLLFCLDDGAALLSGPASMDEPATAILPETAEPGDAATRLQIHTTEQEAGLQNSSNPATEKQSVSANRMTKPLAAAIVGVLVLVGGFIGYRYVTAANSKQIESIAVMPFVNESGNADVEYLSDGM